MRKAARRVEIPIAPVSTSLASIRHGGSISDRSAPREAPLGS
jgi:hypothetical protein